MLHFLRAANEGRVEHYGRGIFVHHHLAFGDDAGHARIFVAVDGDVEQLGYLFQALYLALGFVQVHFKRVLQLVALGVLNHAGQAGGSKFLSTVHRLHFVVHQVAEAFNSGNKKLFIR